MDWDFIIHFILAVGLSAALIALLDSRIKLRKERRKTSMFYGISKDLEGGGAERYDTGAGQHHSGTEQYDSGTKQHHTGANARD